MTTVIKRALGNGLGMSEGDRWRRKRKIMSQLFTHDLIINNGHKFAKLCEEAMEEFEREADKNSKREGLEGDEKDDGSLEYDIQKLMIYLFSLITFEFFIGGDCSK